MLANRIAEEYEKKGLPYAEAKEIGDATAYKIGVRKYGKRGMLRRQKEGREKEEKK
jgi:hypothetical protein